MIMPAGSASRSISDERAHRMPEPRACRRSAGPTAQFKTSWMAPAPRAGTRRRRRRRRRGRTPGAARRRRACTSRRPRGSRGYRRGSGVSRPGQRVDRDRREDHRERGQGAGEGARRSAASAAVASKAIPLGSGTSWRIGDDGKGQPAPRGAADRTSPRPGPASRYAGTSATTARTCSEQPEPLAQASSRSRFSGVHGTTHISWSVGTPTKSLEGSGPAATSSGSRS